MAQKLALQEEDLQKKIRRFAPRNFRTIYDQIIGREESMMSSVINPNGSYKPLSKINWDEMNNSRKKTP